MESRLVALYKSDSEYQILDRQVHKLLYLLAFGVFLDQKLNVYKKMDFPASVFILQKICERNWNLLEQIGLVCEAATEKKIKSLSPCIVMGKNVP